MERRTTETPHIFVLRLTANLRGKRALAYCLGPIVLILPHEMRLNKQI